MRDAQALVKLGLASERARRACERMTGSQRAFEGAVRRALPYLVRRKVPVTSEPACSTLQADVLGTLVRPFHVTPLRVGGSGRTAGALVLDGNAIAHGLDGMLGGGRGEPSPLDTSGLSPAQSALAVRLALGLVAAFGEVMSAIGTPIQIASEASSRDQQGAVLVACAVKIGEGTSAGTIMLLVPAAAIDVGGSVDITRDHAYPATSAAIQGVEIEVVAELGRVPVALSRLASLAVGDVIRLALSVDAPARLHVGGHALFDGKPRTVGSQMAIELVGHGT